MSPCSPFLSCCSLLLPLVQGVELLEMVQSLIEKIRFYTALRKECQVIIFHFVSGNRLGETPKCFLNSLEKYCALEKFMISATCLTV